MSNLTKYLTLMAEYSPTADVVVETEPQRATFQSVKDWLKEQTMAAGEPDDSGVDWLSEEDRQRAIATNHLVQVIWHRNSVGFYILYASSLEMMEENIRQLLVGLNIIEV